ncbi:hypothetical protein PVAP13_5NG038408 [Panicum virgatum]|uniref:Uncharacterized protein n=1 Tax=Panicum virgatum TaxID=38727 RepID=A0A8T0RK99_PANVG|nr:hypothetical protein PVAP13_5NG038408 [Panicum virgatum]
MRNSISIFVLLFTMLVGFVAFPTQCKYTILLLFLSSYQCNPINSTKVNLIFCTQTRCNYFNTDYDVCYCCPANIRRENCYSKVEECRAHCTSCKPQCPLG